MLRLEPEGASWWWNRRVKHVYRECERMREGGYIQFNERQVADDQLSALCAGDTCV